MKKIRFFALLMLVVFGLVTLSACGRGGGNGDTESSGGQNETGQAESSSDRMESQTDRTEFSTDDMNSTGGVIDDIGDGISGAVDDLGDAAGDVMDDIAGDGTTEDTGRGTNLNDENRMR